MDSPGNPAHSTKEPGWELIQKISRKMQVAAKGIIPSVYFVDMLDWLDYVTFDSGPGQMMLKAVRFFAEYDKREAKTLDIKAKVQKLMDLYEDGER